MSEFFNNIFQNLMSGNIGNWDFWTWFIVNICLCLIIRCISYGLQSITYLLEHRDQDFKPVFIENGPEQAAGCLITLAVIFSCFEKTGFLIICIVGILTIFDDLNEIGRSLSLR